MSPPVECEPRLSVILYGRTYDDIRATMRLLAAQTIASSIELIIVHGGHGTLHVPSDVHAAFCSVRVEEATNARSLAEAKAQGVRAATSPIVAFSEDHSFPEPSWAEQIVAAFDSDYAGVAPRMVNGTPDSMFSRIAMTLHFGGGFVENTSGYETATPMASHNMSYRRDVLLEIGDELGARMLMEMFLVEALRNRGYRIWTQPSAVTHHMNMCYLVPLLKHAWIGGRMHGALRVRFHRWSIGRRLLQAAATPLVPPVMMRRALRAARRDNGNVETLAIPAMLLVLVAHAAGETVGNLFGMGKADQRYSLYEVGRDRFVFPAYRDRWA